ncbi:FG-GAP-like repeat-containing protein [Streptomyces sp. NPDC051561]|uniref:FG-GAP-like repeat-containing protein n=1 Tax=Streptomyces sp. NPDC051561 TaxID=3365658 RepID=UPI0037B68E2F
MRKNSNMRRTAVRSAGLIAATAALGVLTGTTATALSGTAAPAQAYPFTAQLDIGSGQQACTGALVDPQWIITATTCFATTPGGGAADGKPALKTTVRVGNPDLTASSVQTREVVQLVTSEDRNVVLAKLATRVQGITPVKLSSTPPTAGETLQAVGFGRTSTEWVPDYLHTGDFTVDYADGVAVGLNGVGKAVLCKGDTGGPTLRVKNGVPELVGINSRSWQGGCLGTDKAETRTAAVASRTDDLGAWVKRTTFRADGDVNSDGSADLAAVWSDGTLHLYSGDKAKGLSGAYNSQIGDGAWGGMKNFAKGDFTGDGVADLMAVWNDGSLHLYRGDGAGKFLAATTVTTGDKAWGAMKNLTAGDFTGDGIADLMAVWADNTLHLYKGTANGQLQGHTTVWGGTGWGVKEDALTAGDFTGDGIADLMSIWNDGTLHMYQGTGTGDVKASIPAMGGTSWLTNKIIAGSDYTGDGVGDLMAVWSDGTLHLYTGNGAGNVNPAITVPVGDNAWGKMKTVV